MATINIHGKPKGAPGSPGDLLSLFDAYLRNPNMVSQTEFAEELLAKMPNAGILVPRGRSQLARQLAGIQRRAGASNITPAAHRRLLDEMKQAQAGMKAFARITGAPLGGSVRSLYAGARAGVAGLGGIETSDQIAAINRLGSVAVGSLMHGGDRGELRKIESTLQRIERTSKQQLAAEEGTGAAGARRRAEHQRTLQTLDAVRTKITSARTIAPQPGIGQRLRGGFMSIAKNPILDGVLMAAMAPEIGNRLFQGAIASASSYTGPRMAFGALGRAGGMNSATLFGQLFPKWKNPPAWMRAAGITNPAGLLSAYGAPITSAAAGQSVLRAIAWATNQKGIGGMAPEKYAQILGQSALLSHVPTKLSGEYLAMLAPLYTLAKRHGIGQGSVTSSWMGGLGGVAAAGAVGLNYLGTRDYVGKLMSSGVPGLRTPQGIATAVSQSQRALTGLGTNPALTMSFLRGAGGVKGLPSNDAELAKLLGPGGSEVVNRMRAHPGTAHQLRDLYTAVKLGNYAFATRLLQSIMASSPGRLVHYAAKGLSGLPAWMKPVALSGMTGESMSLIYAQMYGHGHMPILGGTPASATNILKQMRGAGVIAGNLNVQKGRYAWNAFARPLLSVSTAFEKVDGAATTAAGAVDKFVDMLLHSAKKLDQHQSHAARHAMDRTFPYLPILSGGPLSP